MFYKLNPGFDGAPIASVNYFSDTLVLSIPFDPANTDYQTFKAKINADEAQLEDADGNLLTPNQAKEFIKTLP